MRAFHMAFHHPRPLSEIVEELLPEYKVFGLLANLAVAPSTRRSGLARRLCAKCDEAAASWDLPAISLQAAPAGKAIALTTGLWSARGRRRLPGPSEGWELAYAPRSAASTAGGLAVVALAAPPRAAPTTRLSRASRPQVDGANAAARGLYESVGYGEIWRDETTALRLRPGAADLLASEPSTLITMAKGL